MTPASINPALSIVIATYNRASNLADCLESLSGIHRRTEAECVVCDDGSSDDTFAVVRRFEDRLSLRYYYQPHAGYRLAASRNSGVKVSRGDIVLFLDSDALVAPDLVDQHLFAHARAAESTVVIGPVYGYQVEPGLAADYLRAGAGEWWKQIHAVEAMADLRTPIWASVDGRIDTLTEPWTMLMGTNFSASRETLLDVGAFDEAFTGWGAEDTDLAYRLHRAGAQFALNRDAAVFHQPHEKLASTGVSYLANRRRIYRKCPNLTTELLPYYRIMTYSRRADAMRQLVCQRLIPDYLELWSDDFRARLKELVPGPSYLVGGGEGSLAASLGCCRMSDPDQAKVDRARETYPKLDARCCVGVNLDLDAQAMSTALITDFWRSFDPQVVVVLLKEIRKIARRVLLLFTPEFSVPHASSRPVRDPDALAALLRESEFAPLLEGCELRLERLSMDGPTSVHAVV